MQILACAIVVTVLLGCAKLGHTHYKLRKYSAIAERDKREQALHRQMSQRRRTRTSMDVPFGIRAIESGVEVEGVWISRNNSPEPPSSRDTSRSSVWDATAQKHHEIDLEKQTADPPHVRAGRKSTNGSNATHTEVTKPVKSKQHPPLAYAKYSGNPSLFHQAPTVSTIEGIDAIHRASGPVTAGSTHGDGYDSRVSSRSTSDSSTDTEPISSSAPNLLGHRQKQHSTELDMMHSHRLSQAAETGQLTPRVRRPGARSEWSSISYEQRPYTSSDSGDHSQRVRARSESPIARPATVAGYNSTRLAHPPSLDSLPAAARRSLPDVTPFAQFCRTAPILPRADTRQSVDSNASSKSAMQQVGDSLTQYMSRSSDSEGPPQQAVYSWPAIATRKETATDQSAQTQPEQRTSFEHRGSAVVRGHGSGFEILRPGTFAEQSVERQRSAPPVSLYNNSSSSRPRSNSSESRRKLQKRRPSNDSEASSSGGGGGRWSRVSVF